ncbi:sigma-E factor regulatory protein RseB [Plesiomonas sp. ZOR0011]|uniref:sigma-E factor regulatory protein RseB n=1 Tax=Plesiomonas sp. ZOR0011 TaxID=1339230 RepID=UPI0009DCA469|nr:sigma-E factor regulatory protein RseB [Plesiomonas sp. ZOR0011]
MKQWVVFLLAVLGCYSTSAFSSQGTADPSSVVSKPLPSPAESSSVPAPVAETATTPATSSASASTTAASPSAQQMLERMTQAAQDLSYEMSFIRVNKSSIDAMRYRHARVNNLDLSQMLQLDGPRREVLQRGGEISYFEPGVEPFTIRSSHIVDSMPSVLHADFQLLSQYYDFVPVGRARVVDRPAQVVRIVPRDDFRYSYVVWLDEESKLLLRADLLDRDGETLEQYRVISYLIAPELSKAMAKLNEVALPPVITFEPQTKLDMSWSPSWLPGGFAEISRSRHRLPNVDVPVESKLYSDGLFSFTVYVSPAEGRNIREQLVRQGRRTVQTEQQGQYEVTVVGELPPATAKRIAHGVKFAGSSAPAAQ